MGEAPHIYLDVQDPTSGVPMWPPKAPLSHFVAPLQLPLPLPPIMFALTLPRLDD